MEITFSQNHSYAAAKYLFLGRRFFYLFLVLPLFIALHFFSPGLLGDQDFVWAPMLYLLVQAAGFTRQVSVFQPAPITAQWINALEKITLALALVFCVSTFFPSRVKAFITDYFWLRIYLVTGTVLITMHVCRGVGQGLIVWGVFQGRRRNRIIAGIFFLWGVILSGLFFRVIWSLPAQ